MKGWCLKSVNELELLTVLEALPKAVYLNSSGYLILSNFELREHILRRDAASSDRIQRERETSTFRKKPSEAATGFQLLTSQLTRTCEQMPCQDGDTAFIS